MDMQKILGAIIAISVSVIVVASVLAPTISEYTAAGGSLADYKGLLSAVVIMCIVGVLMIAVRLIGTGRD